MSDLDCCEPSKVIFTSTPRVTVKFNFGEDKTITLPFEMGTTARQLREELSNLLKVPAHDLILSHNSKLINDSQTLADFSITSCGSIMMNLKTNHSIDFSLLLTQMYGDVKVQDVINVSVPMGKGTELRNLSVEIIDGKILKSFIGGYRNQLSGKEYHNACSQTFFSQYFAGKNIEKYERETQTSPRKVSRAEQTSHSAATQTPVKGLFIIDPFNQLITPRRYINTADFKEKVFLFQHKLKSWLCQTRKVLERKSVQGSEIVDENIKIPSVFGQIYENTHSVKRMVDKCYAGKIKVFSNKYFLMKEIKHLMMAENEKKHSRDYFERMRNMNMVKKFCEPYEWIGKKGHKLRMETEHHIEFHKWVEMYSKLADKDIPYGERKLLIISLNEMLEASGNEDSFKVQDLITQEIDLLEAGLKGKDLQTLQIIIEKTFLAYLQNYANKCFPKVEQLTCTNQQVLTCKHCKKVKLESSFRKNASMRKTNQCKSCFWVENMNKRYVDYNIYQQMLRSLQREEEKRNCPYSSAFTLQAEDIYYIVNTLWHGQSILSRNKDLTKLRLCRFDNAIQWSPWNCLFLTYKEMLTHNLVDDPLEVYGAWLIEQVRTKHLMAQQHFKYLYKKSLKPNYSIS